MTTEQQVPSEPPDVEAMTGGERTAVYADMRIHRRALAELDRTLRECEEDGDWRSWEDTDRTIRRVTAKLHKLERTALAIHNHEVSR